MINKKRFFTQAFIALTLVLLISGIAFIGKNGITGFVTTKVYIFETPPANCSVELHAGKNFVSFFCTPGGTLNETLTDANNNSINFTSIFTYSPGTNDTWKSYNPSLPNWTVQDDILLTRRAGYWIIMNHSETYQKEGYKFYNTNIGLKNGWNLIGYPTSVTKNITDALSQIDGKYSAVESYQRINGTDQWLVYVPNGSSNTLDYLEPMHAYWINTTQDTSITINW